MARKNTTRRDDRASWLISSKESRKQGGVRKKSKKGKTKKGKRG